VRTKYECPGCGREIRLGETVVVQRGNQYHPWCAPRDDDSRTWDQAERELLESEIPESPKPLT